MNNKYRNGKIYKLIDNTNGNIYIGSTIKTIENRLSEHRSSYKRYLNGKHRYTSSYNIIKNGDYKIELIELFSCNNKEELINREGFYIRNVECVNKQVAGRKKEEYMKEYRELKRDTIKEYYIENKDRINEKYICICGKEASIGHKLRHERSKKHIKYIKN